MGFPTTKEFDTAAAAVKNFKKMPSNADALKFYSLFKCGTEGKNTKTRPGVFDPQGQAKWDAWDALYAEGISPGDAQTRYVAFYQEKRAQYE